MAKNVGIGKRYFVVKDPIFHRTIHVFLNYTSKEFDAWTRRRFKSNESGREGFDNDFAGFSTAIEIDGQATEWVIAQKQFEWTISNQGTLIHEIAHTIIKIWKHNNIPVSDETQEFFAHSLGNVYEDITAKLFRVKKRTS